MTVYFQLPKIILCFSCFEWNWLYQSVGLAIVTLGDEMFSFLASRHQWLCISDVS